MAAKGRASSTASAVERRRQVHTLRGAGNDWETVAETMGLKVSTCKVYLKTALEVDKLPPLPDTSGPGSWLEERNPERAAEFVTAAMDPFIENMKELRKNCKALGMTPSFIACMTKRIQSKYAPVIDTGKRMLADEMKTMLEQKIWMGAQYLDEFCWSTMHSKDVGVVLTALIDRYELLNGRPTQRVNFTASLEVQQSISLVLVEAKRRGIVLDVPMVERVEAPS